MHSAVAPERIEKLDFTRRMSDHASRVQHTSIASTELFADCSEAKFALPAKGEARSMADSEWQQRYDRSIQETEEAIARSIAERSTAEKIFDRSTVTGTLVDFVIFPFVAIGHGVAALMRRRRRGRTG